MRVIRIVIIRLRISVMMVRMIEDENLMRIRTWVTKLRIRGIR